MDTSTGDADNREAYERLRRTEANRILWDLLRRLCTAELIEEWLGNHGEGCGCEWCSDGKTSPGDVVETLFGLRWAINSAAAQLGSVILPVPSDDPKEAAPAPVLRLAPFSNTTEALSRNAL